MRLDHEKIIDAVEKSRAEIAERLQDCYPALEGMRVPKFFNGLSQFTLTLPRGLAVFLDQHVQHRDSDLDSGQFWHPASLIHNFTDTRFSIYLDSGELTPRSLDRLIGQLARQWQGHVGYELVEQTQNSFNLFGVFYRTDSADGSPTDGKLLDEGAKRFTELIHTRLNSLTAKDGCKGFIDALRDLTVFEEECATRWLRKKGVWARLDIYTNDRDARLAKLYKDHIQKGLWDSKMSWHALLSGAQEIDSSINSVGKVHRAIIDLFGDYYDEFRDLHKVSHTRKIEAKPISPSRIVAKHNFTADLRQARDEDVKRGDRGRPQDRSRKLGLE